MPKRFISSKVRSTARLWYVPLLYILAALGLGRLMPELDSLFPLQINFYSADTIANVLTAIATGMLTFTGLVFSMSLLMIQFSSSFYSHRLAQHLLRDRVVQHALGIFTATFLYALIALVVIDFGETGVISNLTVTTAIVGVFASMILFLALLQRLTTLQVTNVLSQVGDTARHVIEETYPYPLYEDVSDSTGLKKRSRHTEIKTLKNNDLPKITQEVVYNGNPLVTIRYDKRRLVSLAQSADAVIRIRYSVGDYVPSGVCLIEIHGGTKPIDEEFLLKSIEMGRQRVIDQDLTYGIRIIVDIAIRGLSPSINDPTTAVQAIDELDDLLRRIGNRLLDIGYEYDKKGKLRLIYPTPSWEDFLDLTLHEIRHYGATSIAVMRRLHALLNDLLGSLPEERKPLVQEHLDRVNASIRRNFADVYDRLDALEADRQGIGLTRDDDD